MQEGREHEGPADHERDTDVHTSSELGEGPVEARRELSRHLRPSAFPPTGRHC
jgi:hypothetical protein